MAKTFALHLSTTLLSSKTNGLLLLDLLPQLQSQRLQPPPARAGQRERQWGIGLQGPAHNSLSDKNNFFHGQSENLSLGVPSLQGTSTKRICGSFLIRGTKLKKHLWMRGSPP